jgi:Galactose oxidase, central domain
VQAVLFGGCGGEQTAINCLNDVWAFDLEVHRWDKVAACDSGETPAARASFGMCAGNRHTRLGFLAELCMWSFHSVEHSFVPVATAAKEDRESLVLRFSRFCSYCTTVSCRTLTACMRIVL